ncbi:MAG: NaeI family type II restriction endonuclease [Terracidiphilus sp.]
MIARQAIEEVIDRPRTGRERIEELNRAERAYLGTKIEIMFKHWLGVADRKILNIGVDGIEAGVKNVFGARCWISSVRVGRPLLVIQTDLIRSRVSLAALVARSNRTNLASRCSAPNHVEAPCGSLILWLCVDCEIKNSAVFTEMMLMYRKRAEQERLQLRALIDSSHNELSTRKN